MAYAKVTFNGILSAAVFNFQVSLINPFLKKLI